MTSDFIYCPGHINKLIIFLYKSLAYYQIGFMTFQCSLNLYQTIRDKIFRTLFGLFTLSLRANITIIHTKEVIISTFNIYRSFHRKKVQYTKIMNPSALHLAIKILYWSNCFVKNNAIVSQKSSTMPWAPRALFLHYNIH